MAIDVVSEIEELLDLVGGRVRKSMPPISGILVYLVGEEISRDTGQWMVCRRGGWQLNGGNFESVVATIQHDLTTYRQRADFRDMKIEATISLMAIEVDVDELGSLVKELP